MSLAQLRPFRHKLLQLLLALALQLTLEMIPFSFYMLTVTDFFHFNRQFHLGWPINSTFSWTADNSFSFHSMLPLKLKILSALSFQILSVFILSTTSTSLIGPFISYSCTCVLIQISNKSIMWQRLNVEKHAGNVKRFSCCWDQTSG